MTKDNKSEWLAVLVIFITAGLMAASFRIGYNRGEQIGIKKTLNLTVELIKQDMEDPCKTKFLTKLGVFKKEHE